MKNRFFKAILAIALCAVMVLPFVACTPNNDGDNGGGNTSTTGELQFDENGKVIFKNVSIRLETVVNGDDKDAFNALVDTFNITYKNKIRVNYTNTPAASYEQTVAQEINYNNNAPDLIMSHQKSHKNFQTNQLIQPLDNIMEKSGIQINLSNYSDGLAQYSKLGTSNLYSIPADAQTMVVVYNKKVLADLGKDVPTNRQELLDVCAAYKTKTGRSAIGWETGGDYFANYVYLTACLQNGAKLYDENTLKVNWYSDESNRESLQDASESIRELIVNGYAELGKSGSNNLTAFMNGNSLFYFMCPWSLSSLVTNYASEKGINEATLLSDYLGGACTSGWFAMSDNEQKDYLFGDSHFFAMSKTCTDVNKQAAILEFINWFTTNATAGQQWARAGHVSASKVITASAEYKNDAYVTNFMNAFYPNIDNFVSIGVTTYYEAVINNLKGLFADTVTDKTVAMEKTADAYAKYAKEIEARQGDANGQMEDLL